jgi:hypothetical protein
MKMNELDVIEAAINICEMVSGVSPLPRFQSLALRIGIWKMFKDQRDKASPGMLEAKLLGLTQQDIEGYYKDSNDAVSDINLPWEHIQYDASLTANFVGEVVHGGYGSIFGGESSLRDVLSHPVVLLDWTGVSERARTLLSSMLWKWQETAQRNADHDLIPDLYFSDEEHQALGNLMYTRYMSASLKEARARRTAYFMSTQHETDLTMAGEPGTEIRELSESIGLGIGGRFITQQPNKEKVLDLHRELGFSELDTKALTGLRQGHFFFMAQGYPPVPFRLDLTPIEKELVDTESAVRSMTTGFGSISSNGHRR